MVDRKFVYCSLGLELIHETSLPKTVTHRAQQKILSGFTDYSLLYEISRAQGLCFCCCGADGVVLVAGGMFCRQGVLSRPPVIVTASYPSHCRRSWKLQHREITREDVMDHTVEMERLPASFCCVAVVGRREGWAGRGADLLVSQEGRGSKKGVEGRRAMGKEKGKRV